MSARTRLLTALPLLGLLMAVVSPDQVRAQVPPQSLEENTELITVLLRELPWEYYTSESHHTTLRRSAPLYSDGFVERWQYDFRSVSPIDEGEDGRTYLRFSLRIFAFDHPRQAHAALEHFIATADPGMGHSYAWDHLLVHERSVYWLHAGCLYSRANFELMVGRLYQALFRSESPQGLSSVSCWCGSGCELQ